MYSSDLLSTQTTRNSWSWAATFSIIAQGILLFVWLFRASLSPKSRRSQINKEASRFVWQPNLSDAFVIVGTFLNFLDVVRHPPATLDRLHLTFANGMILFGVALTLWEEEG